MRLSEILHEDSVQIPLAGRSKDDVLRELVHLLPCAADTETRDRVHEAVIERESRMSTGIGQGVAIPHGKCTSVSEMEIAFGIADTPIEFDALDGGPVELFFLLISPPDQTGSHIKALAQISRMMSSDTIREELAAARSAGEVLELFRREEALMEE